jgi:chromosome segregation ATPase
MAELPSDIRDLGLYAEDFKATKDKLIEVTAALAAADREARRVPALQREIERAQSALVKVQEERESAFQHIGALEHRIKVLESELRGEEELLRKVKESKAVADEAVRAQADAEDKVAVADAENVGLQEEIDTLTAEVERLQAHEAHTMAFQALLDQTKEL